MTATQRRWLADYGNVCRALERAGMVARHPSGFLYVDATSDDPLVCIYNTLRSVGYARGWL